MSWKALLLCKRSFSFPYLSNIPLYLSCMALSAYHPFLGSLVRPPLSSSLCNFKFLAGCASSHMSPLSKDVLVYIIHFPGHVALPLSFISPEFYSHLVRQPLIRHLLGEALGASPLYFSSPEALNRHLLSMMACPLTGQRVIFSLRHGVA